MPRPRSPYASRTVRSRSSAYVSDVSPWISATSSGVLRARRTGHDPSPWLRVSVSRCQGAGRGEVTLKLGWWVTAVKNVPNVAHRHDRYAGQMGANGGGRVNEAIAAPSTALRPQSLMLTFLGNYVLG